MVEQLLLGNEDWTFLGAVALRTGVMFVVILVGLRVMGKRGVKHLSVFELGVIVGLGSAAGDPMFYSDVGLLPCIIVFAIVLALYHGLEVVLNKNPKLSDRVEGHPVEVIHDGRLIVDAIDHEDFSAAEMFAQLRLTHVSHLGQVRTAILEPTGELSVFFAPDDAVKPGLPILPAQYEESFVRIGERGHYSCRYCGHTQVLDPGDAPSCPTCDHLEWTHARAERRIT